MLTQRAVTFSRCVKGDWIGCQLVIFIWELALHKHGCARPTRTMC